MISWLSLCSILLSILLMGCSSPTTAESPAVTSESSTQTSVNAGQNLPISAEATLPRNIKIQLEVARTQQQQQMGLMYRKALPDNGGMLFLFPNAQPVQFWMKNVPVALDMVFLRQGVVQYIQTSAPPCDIEPCPTYGPNVLIDQVIELRSERAKELGLKKGDQIKIDFLSPGAIR
ncbi:DUF192 domain-containing protein [Aphanizomenon sp. PH219]|uniref:DUF192 domain-containing protein n=1 Tax=Dolichospermum heterosporum TAC447 TaxID=747523 RepID=A0ABY5LUF6_9CYAN|nr:MULTISPECIES: DUF192 domain-containing protein [Aphanizomenonaceae]MDK2412524.1 DUF192 domain-containing protein [Aphanizomenon sp. 202]MDK2458959.1 DUF192 domain-containing protein [Aphanizomenon sp. PH219]UUO15641.1 DUF192 domain-containing protein [Dolichospermum heterosporum TAC447]